MELQKTVSGRADGSFSQVSVTESELNDSDRNEEIELTPSSEPVLYSIGNQLSYDFMDFSFEKIEWTDDVKPHTEFCSSRYYSHYSQNAKEIYLVIWGNVKNLSGENINIDNIDAEFVFNDKYTYSGVFRDEDDDHCGFGVGYIKPLRETGFVLYVSVPEEVKSIYTDAVLTFGFNDKLKKTYGDITEKEYIYRMAIR